MSVKEYLTNGGTFWMVKVYFGKDPITGKNKEPSIRKDRRCKIPAAGGLFMRILFDRARA